MATAIEHNLLYLDLGQVGDYNEQMRRYLVYGTTCLVLLLTSIGGTSVSVAFPDIVHYFNTSLILTGWVLGASTLAMFITAGLAGKISDRLGRKNSFIIFVGIFGAASVLCSMAPNIELLIVFRFLQGIGGGGLMPAAAGIAAHEFPESRQQAIGFYASIFPVGQIIGPNVGAVMVHTMGWRSVFWINLPLVAISLVAAAILMKPSEKEVTPIDWSGASLFSVSLAMFMVSLTIIGSSVPRFVVVLMFAVSIALIIILFRREVHVTNPIIDVSILRKRPFLALNMYNFIYGACVLGFFSFIPLYAVSVYNMSTLESGLILTPRSVAMILGSLVTSYYLQKWGYRWPLLVGTAFTIVTLVLLAIHPMDFRIFGLDIQHITLLFLIMALGGLGGGISAPASNNASIELMPYRVATITGIRNMFRMGGGSVGTVVATLILNSHPDAARGFTLLFGALAAGLCLAIPLIFAVPRRAERLATAITVAKSGDLQR